LLIAPQAKDIFNINSYTDVVNYYIQLNLNKLGVDYEILPMRTRKELSDNELIAYYKSFNLNNFDVVVGLGLRFFTSIPRECGDYFKSKAYVIQFYDGSMLDSPPVHLTLTTRDDSGKYPKSSPANRYERHHKFNEFLGWAADKELFRPQQYRYTLRILVDHTIYDTSQPDRTIDILIKIKGLVDSSAWCKIYQKIVVRMIVDGFVQNVDLENLCVSQYKRKGIPYIEIAEELNRSDIYFVTHGESVGLNALEAAMAGALVISPEGFIQDDLLKKLHHVKFEKTLDWSQVLEVIDPEKSREMAIDSDWAIVVDKMLNIIEKRYKEHLEI